MRGVTITLVLSMSMAASAAQDTPEAHVATARTAVAGFQTYVDSAKRFSDIVTRAGADVIISNHTNYDGSKVKQPALATRKAGDPHPYVVGTDSVKRYLKVAEECATARLVGMR